MVERLSPSDLIRSNPRIDPGELERGRELLRQLRKIGRRLAEQKIVSPVARRRVLAGDEPSKDPRAVQLKSRR